jgi:hypothetical protein
VETKSALLNHATHPLRKRPDALVGSVKRQVWTMIFFRCLVFKVKIPDPVRAGDNTITAANASPEVLYHDAILAVIGRLGRTYDNAGRILTMHTGHRDEVSLLGRVFALTDSENFMPERGPSLFLLFRRTMRHVIFGFTGK